MLPGIGIVSALLMIICYYAWITSKYKLPSSFCAGSLFLHKYDKKYEWIPNVLLCIMTLATFPTVWYISMIVPCALVGYIMQSLCFLKLITFTFVGITIGMDLPYRIHEHAGEIGEVFLWLWTILACTQFNVFLIPLVIILLISNLKAIHKKTNKNLIRTLFWVELYSYSVYYITIAFIMATLLLV